MTTATPGTGRPVPGRNIILACGHPEGLATLHRDEQSAWCPVCEADVEVSKTEDLPEREA